jgi:hypothetical protein
VAAEGFPVPNAGQAAVPRDQATGECRRYAQLRRFKTTDVLNRKHVADGRGRMARTSDTHPGSLGWYGSVAPIQAHVQAPVVQETGHL